MSDTDRDHRGRRRSGKCCNDASTGGCDYCRTGMYKRIDNRKSRQKARKEALTITKGTP